MLPKVLPHARIMAFGYNSVWFGKNAVKETLDGVAGKLLAALRSKRSSCPRRPIILIGHCFGGLVIQQMYSKAVLHTQDWPDVATSISGMMFLGTPHQGIHERAGLSTQGEMYTAILQAGLQIQDSAMQSMAQDNEGLVSTVFNFNRGIQMCKPQPKVFCFYEQKATNVGEIFGMDTGVEFVVSEASGTLSNHMKEGLPLDHFQMNKFEDAEDNHFQRVSEELERMAEGLGEGRSKNASVQPSLLRSIPNLPAPIAREAHFSPRDNVLQTIETRFRKNMMVVLCGDSGSGKTHVAVEYAHRYHAENQGVKVHWVNSNSAEQFEFSYKRIAEALHLIHGASDKVNVLETVQRHLKQFSAGPWLMVLDGLDDDEVLKATEAIHKNKSLLDFVPSSFSARVLITTRSKSLATSLVKKKSKDVINVNPLNDDDASILLLGKVTKNRSRKQWVEALSKELKGSPGAMTLAFTYMKNAEEECNLKEYMTQISTQPETKPGVKSGVKNAWRLLHQRLAQKRPDTVDFMMQICALEVQFVPSLLFERSQVLEDATALKEYGIVEPSLDRSMLCVTALFRRCAQEWLANHAKERSDIEAMLLSLVCDKFTEDMVEVLLPCALAVLKFEPSSAQAKRDMATLLFKVSQHHQQIGQYQKGLGCLQRCLALREGSVDAENGRDLIEETKKAIQNIKLLESQPAAASKELTSDDHGTSLHAASRHLQQLENDDAEWQSRDTARQASHLAALQLDGNKVETARAQYNLALAHDSQGRSKDAEELYRSALKMVQEQLETENPDLMLLTLHVKILDSLACMYCDQQRLDEAEAAFRVVYPAKRDLLGIDHPETLMTRHNMALLVQERGHVEAATTELHEVLKAQVRLLERFDPATLRTVCSIALNHRLCGNLNEAKRLYVALLKLQTKLLGEKHRDTRATRVMLDELLMAMGRGESRKARETRDSASRETVAC
ncbi:putative kinesin [Thelonectria olida]|uniref:Kinesin n=1 Tax=Thelonectria olida TaxID=1576542 RepID=A0A9P8W337_9HYPO|nr:putative kinesin [Thelonectria olida]